MSDYGSISVRSNGFFYVGEVKVGRILVKNGKRVFQVCDKDRRRSSKRGTQMVEVSCEQLANELAKESEVA